MAEVRVYFIVHADTVAIPSHEQWRALFAQTKTYPLAQAVLQYARAPQHFITTTKRSLGSGVVNRFTLVGFEVRDDAVSAILAVVDAQAVLRGIGGGAGVRFTGVLEGELQDAATDLGYGAQAANLSIPWFTQGGRTVSILAAQQKLRDDTTIWHA